MTAMRGFTVDENYAESISQTMRRDFQLKLRVSVGVWKMSFFHRFPYLAF